MRRLRARREPGHKLIDVHARVRCRALQGREHRRERHGGGGELEGSTRKQKNEAFQRLKDRLFSLRRDRLFSPTGTPRASQRRASGAGSSTDPL